jgi:glycosyltransferase involved in cell wall biosynthesis
MACGLPVVASSRAGASEIINDRRNGMILRDPEDSQELAGLLRALCANPDLYRQIGGGSVADRPATDLGPQCRGRMATPGGSCRQEAFDPRVAREPLAGRE